MTYKNSQKDTLHLSHSSRISNKTFHFIYYVLLTVLMVFVIYQVLIFFDTNNQTTTKINTPDIKLRVPNDEDLIIGKEAARYQIILFTDYECPYCKDLEADIPTFFRDFGTSTVAFRIRHLPLAIHGNSFQLAIDMKCTQTIFGNNRALELGRLLYSNLSFDYKSKKISYPKDIRESKEMEYCMNSATTTELIRKDASEALVNELSKTPSIAIYDSKKGIYIFKYSGGSPYYYKKVLKKIISEDI